MKNTKKDCLTYLRKSFKDYFTFKKGSVKNIRVFGDKKDFPIYEFDASFFYCRLMFDNRSKQFVLIDMH